MVMAILAITTAPLLGVMHSTLAADDRQGDRTQVRLDLDRAVALAVDDIRSGEPRSSPDAVGELRLALDDSAGSQVVTWAVRDGSLERSVDDAATGAEVEHNVVVDGPGATEVRFRYFDADGDQIPAAALDDDVRVGCVTRIEIDLGVETGDDVLGATASASPRGRTPGANAC